MMLGFALNDNGGRNGQFDKKRMIPSRIHSTLQLCLYICLFRQNLKSTFPLRNYNSHNDLPSFHDIAWQRILLICP